MLIAMISTALLVALVVLAPFWLTSQVKLSQAAGLDSPEQVNQAKEAVLQEYVGSEADFNKGVLDGFEWRRRREFLESRYIDLSRRCDSLVAAQGSAG